MSDKFRYYKAKVEQLEQELADANAKLKTQDKFFAMDIADYNDRIKQLQQELAALKAERDECYFEGEL